MSKRMTLLTCAFLAAGPLSSLFAQADPQGRRPAHPMYQEETRNPVIVEYFQPKKAPVEELISVMHRLYQGGGVVQGYQTGIPPVFATFGETLLIKAQEQEMKDLVALLQRLDSAYVGQAPRQGTRLETFHYQVRHVPIDSILRGLTAFQMRDTGRIDVSAIEDRGVVILRGSPADVADASSLIERIDAPPPKVLLTFYVVQGSSKEDTTQWIPADLVRDLTELVPYVGFEVMSTGILPSDTVSEMTMQDELKGGAGEFQMILRPQAFDRASGTLTLGKVDFDMSTFDRDTGEKQRRSFSTSTSVVAGQYTVLGAVGADPVFVVVQMTGVPTGDAK